MKKINIGIILVVVAMIISISYATYEKLQLENKKEKDKLEILDFLKEYYVVYNKYSVLKEEDRIIDKEIDLNSYEDYFDEMLNDISLYVLDTEKDKIYELYKNRFNEQFSGLYMRQKYEKEIVDIVDINYDYHKDFSFYFINLGQVTKSESQIRKNPVYDSDLDRYVGDVTEIKELNVEYENNIEFLVVKKENGKYKIVQHAIK